MAKKIPRFKRNDDCTFETDPSGSGPRWVLNVDKGYSGLYADAIVTEVTKTAITVDALFPDNEIRVVNWPNIWSTDYEEEQWWYPGYLKKPGESGPDCECGYGNNSAIHFLFCPRRTYLRNQNENTIPG